jgi:hypothetical protein
MVDKTETTARVIVIDTSWLLDFYGIPGSSSQSKKVDPKVRENMYQHLKNASENCDLLFVPWPCIFEVGNHIAKAFKANQRELAQRVLDDVKTSVDPKTRYPWTLTPIEDISINFLPELFEKFATKYAGKNSLIEGKRESIGLTDAFTIAEVERLEKCYPHRKVHIWTTDELLKSYAHDREENPYPPRRT